MRKKVLREEKALESLLDFAYTTEGERRPLLLWRTIIKKMASFTLSFRRASSRSLTLVTRSRVATSLSLVPRVGHEIHSEKFAPMNNAIFPVE